MTNTQPCLHCAKPNHEPAAYICPVCGTDLERALQRVATLAGDINLTVARLARVTTTGTTTPTETDEPFTKAPNALYPTPLPVDLGAAKRHDQAAAQLTAAAHRIAAERGTTIPTPQSARCAHTTCAARRRREILGPTCPPTPPEHPLATLARWLSTQVMWLRHQPASAQAFADLHRACRTIEGIIDRPPNQLVVGRCPCDTYLYAKPGASFVRCRGCGTSYDVAASRDGLRTDLDDRLLTAAQIARMAVYLGLTDDRDRTRRLINKWAQRRLITAHGAIEREPAFRFGEVLTRLLAVKAKVA